MSDTVFRRYTRAELDREYDNRAKVPTSVEVIAGWGPQSAQTREALPCRLDIAFGPSAAEILDVFPAAGGDPAPINVFYHGGYWRALHKDDFSYVARAFQPAGAATVVVNYALVPEVPMSELVRQCRAALAWVWHNAHSFGGDRNRIHVSGHSAGGHLVAMMMATDWTGFDPRLPAEPVRGGCGISGLYDLEPIRLCYLNEALGLSPVDAARESPVLLPRTCRGPLLLAVGDKEGAEYLRQSTDLRDAWADAGEPPVVDVMPDHDHFSIAAQLDDHTSPLARAIQRQMGL